MNIGIQLILKNISQIKKIKILSLLKKHSWEGLIVLDLMQLECLASLLLCQVKSICMLLKEWWDIYLVTRIMINFIKKYLN